MPTYAKDTDVPVSRSQGEIEQLLDKYGATGFAYAKEGNRVMIAFRLGGRHFRMLLDFPDRNDPKFANPERAPHRRTPSPGEAYEQEVRRRWRVLVLWLKSTLVLVDEGIVSVEQALQAFVLLPDGRTTGEWLAPQIDQAYRTGQMPSLLPGPRSDL